MPTETEEISREDVTGASGTDETFDGEAVPVPARPGHRPAARLRVAAGQRRRAPWSLLGFALELIYQTGAQDAVAEMRGQPPQLGTARHFQGSELS